MHGRARGGLIALVAALATAPAAGAAAPLPGQIYEGPGPKGGYPVILEVSASGSRVKRINFGIERGCRIKGRRLKQAGPVFRRNVRIRNGRFSWKQSVKYPRTGGWFTSRVSGRFVDGGARVVGTVRERLRNPQTGGRCDSGTVRFSARVAERVLVNGDWAGATAQGRPVTLTITKEGITAMAFEVTLACRNGEQITRPLAPLRSPGRVDGTDLSFTTGSWTGDTQIQVTGTARRSLVSGTIVAEDSIERLEGEDTRVYSCTSGAVAFEARRPA